MKPLDHRQLQRALDAAANAAAAPPPAAGAEDFRLILESIPQMVWAHLPGEEKHEYYNGRWRAFTGVELQPDGTTRRDLIHPGDRARAVAAWQAALAAGRPYECVYRLHHHSGDYRWIMSRGVPARDPDGQIRRWYGASVDIHEHMLAREALAASEALNRGIIQASADAIGMIDADGTILFLNAAALKDLEGGSEPEPETRHPAPVASGFQVSGFKEEVTRNPETRNPTPDPRHPAPDPETEAQSPIPSPQSPIVGLSWLATLPEEARPRASAAMKKALAGQTARFTVARVRSAPRFAVMSGGHDGPEPLRHVGGNRYRWRDYAVTPIYDTGGAIGRLVFSARDVTEEREVQEQLRWIANHDALTRLPNRSFFQACLAEALRQGQRDSLRVGLLIIDVDHLKQLNDALGHAAGDRMLCVFAERLADALPGACVGRLGGDEFGVILSGIAAVGGLGEAADKVLESLREPFIHEGRLLECRASIGAGLYPDQSSEAVELMKQADLALQVAKSAGRAQWVVFDPAMRAEMQNRASVIALARDALRDGRIFPCYQPKIDLRTRRVAGFEALLRWKDPRGSIRLPGDIAAAIEDSDISNALSERVIGSCILDMRAWLDAGLAFHHVAVNVSAVDLRAPDFAEALLQRLERAGVPPGCLQVEVTETVFLGRGAESVERALLMLHEAGVGIALDDFGTGFSSLSHLKKFPVGLIKIDRSFIRDLESDANDAAIIRSVIKMSRSLDIRTVAEGIEAPAQEDFLIREGCDYGQGWLYGKAVPAAQVAALVTKDFSRQA